MKKVKKLIYCVLFMMLGVCLCAISFTVSAETTSGQCGENAYWSYDSESKEMRISGTGIINSEIPCFEDCYIIIENGITGFQEDLLVFKNIEYLTAIYIPDSISYISENFIADLHRDPEAIASSQIPMIVYCQGNPEWFEGFADNINGIAIEINNNYEYTDHDHIFEKQYSFVFQEPCFSPYWTENTCDCGFRYYNINPSIGDHSFRINGGYEGGHGPCHDPDGDGLVVRILGCEYCADRFFIEEPVVAHTYGDWYYDIPPCKVTEETSTRKYKECRVCSERLFVETTVTPSDHYVQEWETVKAANCIENGKETGVCMYCNQEQTRETDLLAHDMGDWEILSKATCTQEGEKIRYCQYRSGIFNSIKCEYSEKQAIPVEEHKMGEWYDVKAATCCEYAKQERICQFYCGYSETRNGTEKLAHSMGDWLTEEYATCSQEGRESRRCTSVFCDYTESRSTQSLGHIDADDDNICDRCGEEIEKSIFDKIKEFFNDIIEWIKNLFR